MEYVLKNTDIFDRDIDGKFNELIKASKNDLTTENIY